MPNLYLEEIFSPNSTNPSSVKIGIPTVDNSGNKGKIVLCGLLAGEPTIVTSNKWGPILNDLSMLSFFASLTSMESIPSWIGASVQCWKGTDPLRINLDFYLVNYSQKLKLEEGLRALTKLTALSMDKNTISSVFIHGGYKANVLAPNIARFDNAIANDVHNGQPDSNDSFYQQTRNVIQSTLEDLGRKLAVNTKDNEGCVVVDIGNKTRLNGLLVANVNVTPSVVEVPGGKPLYYHVTLALIGHRPLISDDVNEMYQTLIQ